MSKEKQQSSSTHWELCILCSEETEEQVICPLTNPVASRRDSCYHEIIEAIAKFEAIEALPNPGLILPPENVLRENRASWHKSCRNKYANSVLARATERYNSRQQESNRQPRMNRRPSDRNLCLFCGEQTDSHDHSFQKLALTKEIHDKAVELQDHRVVAELAEGDLVAIEARYHRNCYIGFNRRFDKLKKIHLDSQEDVEVTAENEMFEMIKEEIEAGVTIFSLFELSEQMRTKLKERGITKKVNPTRLKQSLLDQFPDFTEEKGTRNRVYLICSKTARKIISEASQSPEEESRALWWSHALGSNIIFNNKT